MLADNVSVWFCCLDRADGPRIEWPVQRSRCADGVPVHGLLALPLAGPQHQAVPGRLPNVIDAIASQPPAEPTGPSLFVQLAGLGLAINHLTANGTGSRAEATCTSNMTTEAAAAAAAARACVRAVHSWSL